MDERDTENQGVMVPWADMNVGVVCMGRKTDRSTRA